MRTLLGILVLLSYFTEVCYARYRYYSYYSYRSYYRGGSKGSGNPLAGIIVGAVIGGIVLIGGIIFLICMIKYCNRKKTRVVANQPSLTQGNITMVSQEQPKPNDAWPHPAYPPPPAYPALYSQPGGSSLQPPQYEQPGGTKA